MKKYVDEFRQLHHEFNPDQSVSALDYKPCWDLRVSSSRTFGPFPDLESFYHHLLKKVKQIDGESKAMSLFQALISLKPPQSPSMGNNRAGFRIGGSIWKLIIVHSWQQRMRTRNGIGLWNLAWWPVGKNGINVQIKDIEGFPYWTRTSPICRQSSSLKRHVMWYTVTHMNNSPTQWSCGWANI